MKHRSLTTFGALHGTLALLVLACSSPSEETPGGSSTGGVTPATGGTTTTPTGGTTPSTGGTSPSTGGTTPSTGGATTGGSQSGGVSTGGSSTSGGTTSSGGAVSTGGASSSGGFGRGGSTVGGNSTGGRGGKGTAGSGGASAGASSGGVSATGGSSGTGGAATGGNSGTGGAATGGASTGGLAKFSFFVTSYKALQDLAGTPNGFGGDLRFGETGDGAGLRGADKICTQIAEKSMPGSSVKVWRAFLSAPAAGASPVVNAKDRVGTGPWYDRKGRLVANDLAGLLTTRPGGDAAIVNDLPNEDGVPNHDPDGTGAVDNHDMLTGSDAGGLLYTKGTNPTCSGWTTKEGSAGKPRCGHSWPRGVQSWISILDEAGCGAGVNLIEMGGPNPANPTVGSGGGYGGFYCLALAP